MIRPPLMMLSVVAGLFAAWSWAAFEMSRYGTAATFCAGALGLARAALWCNDEVRR